METKIIGEGKKNKKKATVLGIELQSVNPAESGLPIITSLNAIDSKEWVNRE